MSRRAQIENAVEEIYGTVDVDPENIDLSEEWYTEKLLDEERVIRRDGTITKGEVMEVAGQRTEEDSTPFGLKDNLFRLKMHEEHANAYLSELRAQEKVKSLAVATQLARLDDALECRIKIQKPLSLILAHRNSEIPSELSSELSSISIQMIHAFYSYTKSICQFDTNDVGIAETEDLDSEWRMIDDFYQQFRVYRDKDLEKWDSKLKMSQKQLQAISQPVHAQVKNIMENKELIGRYLSRSRKYKIEAKNESEDHTYMEDEEIYDDTDFYVSLLKDFIKTDQSYKYGFSKSSKRKKSRINRKASKGRVVRYNLHEKLTNFMVPQPLNLPLGADGVLSNLFGGQ